MKLSLLNCHIYQLIHTHTSVHVLRLSSTVHVFCIKLSAGEIKVGARGHVVSNIIVSVISLVIFANASRVAIYTVFTQSHVVIVRNFDVEHHVRFVGLELFPYAISIHDTHASVGHVIFNVTNVKFVPLASLLILNANHIGALSS
jgi:hypothetical protein